MFVRSICLLLAILGFIGCSAPPTAPSAIPTADSRVPGTVTDNLTIVPPRALGVTRFVAFGDSITWGATSGWLQADQTMFFAAANGGYAERLQAALSLAHTPQRFTVFNEGLPGELAINALSRFRSMLTTRRPEVVLLLEGINDISNEVSVSRVSSALRDMLDAAALSGVPVLLATMYQTYEEVAPDGSYRPNGASMVPALNTEIRRLATGRLNVYLVDLEPFMRDRRLVGADGIHLEDAGFDVMTARFQAVIDATFTVRGSFQ